MFLSEEPLELTVIIGGSEDKFDSRIEVGRHYEFLLQFLTPGILGTLGYSDNNMLVLLAAGKEK